MILLETALSFLGIGIQPPMASWGSIISDGRDVLLQAWWVSTIPGIFIILTVICFNIIGEGIRESLGWKAWYQSFCLYPGFSKPVKIGCRIFLVVIPTVSVQG